MRATSASELPEAGDQHAAGELLDGGLECRVLTLGQRDARGGDIVLQVRNA